MVWKWEKLRSTLHFTCHSPPLNRQEIDLSATHLANSDSDVLFKGRKGTHLGVGEGKRLSPNKGF